MIEIILVATFVIVAAFLVGYLIGLTRKYAIHESTLKDFEEFCNTEIAEFIEKQSILAEQKAIPDAVKKLVRGDGEPGSYRRAAGVIPWKEGDELPEDTVRRGRGG
jgi:hypothetical protein